MNTSVLLTIIYLFKGKKLKKADYIVKIGCISLNKTFQSMLISIE